MPLPLLLGLAAAAVGTGLVKSQVEKNKENEVRISQANTKGAAEAKAYQSEKTKTDSQEKAIKLLFKNAFSDSDKKEKPPISSEWTYLPKETRVIAARNYSLFSWNEYSFFTNEAVYYHHKRKGIHEFLYYDKINDFDMNTGIVDYGKDHQKKDISNWANFEKKFVEQISCIWKTTDKVDTSVLEFCFNNCSDFSKQVKFFKASGMRGVFNSQCQRQNVSKTLKENFDHISVSSIENGKIKLQFWTYFPRVENVMYNEDDSDYERRQKELEQERLELEAEERERKAHFVYNDLLDLKSEITELFQQSLYILYGTLFDVDKIEFVEEPDFTYEGPSMLEKVRGAMAPAENVLRSQMASTANRAADIARKSGDMEKYEYYKEQYERYK